MKIGTSRILVCPFCGEEKEIMSLAMGNTLGAQLWSDNKLIARMLPECPRSPLGHVPAVHDNCAGNRY